MSRHIHLPDVAVATELPEAPPGAFVSKFYREGDLEPDGSGYDAHPTGGRLIKIVAYLITASTSGAITVGMWKNDVQFLQFSIAQGETGPYVIDLTTMEFEVSMDFVAITDTLRASILIAGLGAQKLTILGIFDR